MALDPTNVAPCNLLNTTGFPSLFIVTEPAAADSVTYPRIATGRVLKRYVDSLVGVTLTNDILLTKDSSSSFRLVKFLSGAPVSTSTTPGTTTGANAGSSTGAATPNYSTLGALVLKNSTDQNQGIIDTYIAPMKTNYLTLTSFTRESLLSASEFWTPSDVSDGIPAASPVSVLGKLIKAGHLLSKGEIYTPGQIVAGAVQPAANTESLIYIYNLSQKSTLTAAQVTLRDKLESRNLKFFGAFMVEYCYYKTRYEWLLKKFFTVYRIDPTVYESGQTSQPDAVAALFTSGRSTTLTQSDYLQALAYQMASLNMRLEDMRTLLSKINIYYNDVFRDIQSDINSTSADGSNEKLTKTINALKLSADNANKYISETDFAQEAMEYNSEKNRYSNILLGLYAFLNIAALATVFQLARN